MDDANEIKLEEVCWEIIDTYFKDVSHYISKNQIDSYNMFIDEHITKTIRQFNPIQLVYTFAQTDDLEVDIIVGGSKSEINGNINIINDGLSIRIGKPIIFEKGLITTNTKGDDGVVTSSETIITKNKQLYPNEARLKNLTYTMAVYTDIHFIFKQFDRSKDMTNPISIQYKTIENALLGKIPLMLHSKGCVLSSIPQSNLKDFGECPYDQGGYFIIDGKEKVITAQTRQVENKIYIYKCKPEDKEEFRSEIRSVPEDTLQPARITNVYIRRLEKDLKNTNNDKENLLFVGIPNIKEQVPIFIIFRALGITADKDILQCIIGDLDTPFGKQLLNMLYENVLISSDIRTQLDAIQYLQNLIKPIDEYKKKSIISIDKEHRDSYIQKLTIKNDIEFKYIYDILYNYLFPHMGTTNLVEKGYFLGYMTNQLLKTKMGLIEVTDRDNYMYKRIDVSGFLVANIFRDLYFRVKNLIFYKCNQIYESGKTAGLWNMVNITELVNITNLETVFDHTIMTDGFKYAFKKCWGLKNAPAASCKQGVVQDLARLTYLGMISHLRRVVTPLGSSSKMRGPHMLHLSTYGILCPIETPDGGNVGVKTNIALMTDITFGTHSASIYQALLDCNLIDNMSVSIDYVSTNKLTKILLNGRLIGYHDKPNLLVHRMRLLRRNALINVYTSIAWYIELYEIRFSTDSGRSCHPMIIVQKGKLSIKNYHIKGILNNTITWQKLIGGNALDTWNQYDNKYYRTNATDDELERSSGVIEFIDTEEANTMLIAMNQGELINNKNSKFTHCEIHPSIIFGIMGSIIPYVQTNQLPRNIYSCGQGKQAIGVYASNFRNRMDTKTQVLYYSQKPIVQNRISKHLYNNILPYGINAIIAISCYTGYNQDDSIIFNKSSLNRGLFRSVKFRTYAIREETNEYNNLRSKICNPITIVTKENKIVVQGLKSGDYSKLDPNTGIIREGLKVNENDIVVGKVRITNDKDEFGNTIYIDESEYVRRSETGFIDKVFYSYDNNDYLFVKVRLRKEKIPELGDKFASRAGQKGIMGMQLHEMDMPVSKYGIRPDMIINPQAFPKRMTISQFVETQQTKQCSLLGIFGDSSPFQDIPLDKMGEVLERLGFEKTGCEVLYNGMSGMPLEHDIFIGPTYYERLQHQVEDKMHSRDIGAVTMLNKQPTGGRSIGGGLRIGEMERDAILSHGTALFLKETMGDRADSSDFYICNGCGFIGMVNTNKQIYHCYSCNSTQITYQNGNMHKEQIETSKNDFSKIQIPYAMKLLTQELDTLSIGSRIITKSSSMKWKNVDKYSTHQEITNDLDMVLHLKNDKYYEDSGFQLDKPMRKFHNLIKTLLLEGARVAASNIQNKPKLVDFSAGRGGDIDKWILANYGDILALDINESNIFGSDDSFETRIKKAKPKIENSQFFQSSKIDYGLSNMCRNFYNGEAFIDTNPKNQMKLKKIIKENGKNSYDVVSTMFSIHYCFDNIVSVRNCLQNISDSLRDGGISLITTMNGSKVYQQLKQNDGNIEVKVNGYEDIIYSIRSGFQLDLDQLPSDESSLGKQIFVRLGTTGQEFPEFLVHPEFLIEQAKQVGLVVMDIDEFRTFFKYLTLPVDTITSDIQKLSEINISAKTLHKNRDYESLLNFSSLNNYYVFVKQFQKPGQATNLHQGGGNKSRPGMELSKPIEIKINKNCVENTLFRRELLGKINTTPFTVVDNLPKSLNDYINFNILGNTINPEDLQSTINELISITNHSIYCLIKNGKIEVFTPLYKIDNTSKKYNSVLLDNTQHILDKLMEKYIYYPETGSYTEVNKDINIWYKEGCVLNTQMFTFNDLYYNVVYSMFDLLCQTTTVPDTDLIIYIGEHPLKSHEIVTSFPILTLQSLITTKHLSIPNAFDWWCISKFLSNGNGISQELPDWSERVNQMIFRGSSNSCGTTPDNNIRLAAQSIVNNMSDDLQSHIDFKITEYDRSLLFISGNENIVDFTKGKTNYNENHSLDFVSQNKENPLSKLKLIELAKSKYILYLDSYGASYKYSYLMTLGSTIIKLQSDYTLWYSNLLKPQLISSIKNKDADHILINNLDELPSVLQWCLLPENDEHCKLMGMNAQKLAETILNRTTIINYLSNCISKIHNRYDSSTNYSLQIPKDVYVSNPEYINIDIRSMVAHIIHTNKHKIEGYFDVSINSLKCNKDLKSTFETFTINGNNENCNKCYTYIDDLNTWEITIINNVNKELIDNLLNIKHIVESNFNIYIMVDKYNVHIFGNNINTELFTEYIDNSQNELPQIPWINVRDMTLDIDVLQLDNYRHFQKCALVFLCRDIDNKIIDEDISAFTERSKFISEIISQLSTKNVDTDVFYFKQSLDTSMKSISRYIVVNKNKDGEDEKLFGKLKSNPIALLKAANNLISSNYDKLVVFNLNTTHIIEIFNDFAKNIISVEQGLTIINRNTLIVSNRAMLNSLPDDLYGIDILDLDNFTNVSSLSCSNFLNAKYILKTNDITLVNRSGSNSGDKMSEFVYRYHKNRAFFNEDYFNVKIHKQMLIDNNSEFFEIDFNDRTLPIILENDQYPVYDMSIPTNITKWINAYLLKYYDKLQFQIQSNSMDTANLDNYDAIIRLLPGIEFILMNEYAIIISLIHIYAEAKLTITVEYKEPIIIEENKTFLPYYTIRHKYYIRSITPEMKKMFEQRIKEISKEITKNKELHISSNIPNHNLYIRRIGNFALYLDTITDDIAIYDIALQQMITIDDLSTPLHDFDFNMLIILFKNENDSILKLISFNDTSKLTIDPMDINKLIVPNLEKFISMAPVRSKTIDRFTQQSLLYEPVFNEYGDKIRGQSD
jgi:DNA-directed RNA polymerase II subunit RPB2